MNPKLVTSVCALFPLQGRRHYFRGTPAQDFRVITTAGTASDGAIVREPGGGCDHSKPPQITNLPLIYSRKMESVTKFAHQNVCPA